MKSKKLTLKSKNKKYDLKIKRIRKKALRNSKKSFATTKSFNDSTNDFIPEIEHIRNPYAVLYLRLKNDGKLPLTTKGKPITYKQWIDMRIEDIRKRI